MESGSLMGVRLSIFLHNRWLFRFFSSLICQFNHAPNLGLRWMPLHAYKIVQKKKKSHAHVSLKSILTRFVLEVSANDVVLQATPRRTVCHHSVSVDGPCFHSVIEI